MFESKINCFRWEDEVIWDTDNMPKPLKPSIVSLDPNDENIIIAIPDDIDPDTLPNEEPARKIKIIQKHVKKSKLLLNRAGIISGKDSSRIQRNHFVGIVILIFYSHYF